MPDVVKTAVRLGVPVFGVCLGLQGIVEAFGGELGVLDYPMHGKPSTVRHRGVGVFEGLPEEFQVGRYHSLFARRETFPACLEVTAETEDGVIMGVRHRELPIEAVQFHPESILTAEGDHGLKLMQNAVRIGKPPRSKSKVRFHLPAERISSYGTIPYEHLHHGCIQCNNLDARFTSEPQIRREHPGCGSYPEPRVWTRGEYMALEVPSAVRPKEPPSRLSHYQIVRKLGEGGMGVVYQARDLDLGRFVALKFLPPGDRSIPERHRPVSHRGSRDLRVKPPAYRDHLRRSKRRTNTSFWCSNTCPGGTLRQKLAARRASRRGLPVSQAVEWGLQIADALAHAHSRGIVHRDIKASNVLFTEEGEVKIADFGVAKIMAGADRDTADESRLQPGCLVGTPLYMSPEQARGLPVDERSDVFSLGVLLFEMVAGQAAVSRGGYAGAAARDRLPAFAAAPATAAGRSASDYRR